jgi:hypothetical protein
MLMVSQYDYECNTSRTKKETNIIALIFVYCFVHAMRFDLAESHSVRFHDKLQIIKLHSDMDPYQ